jgi:hypothetical protein
MRALIATLLGVARKVLDVILPFLKSKVMDFVSDPEVQKLALQAVENAAGLDLDGDGKVELAVGAQWSPGETSDTTKSGAVFFLLRPDDHNPKWEARPLHHEPTTHRMRWMKDGKKSYLIVVPLHGRGNANGEGAGVKVIAYEYPKNPAGDWTYEVIDESMHLTHNLDVIGEELIGDLLSVPISSLGMLFDGIDFDVAIGLVGLGLTLPSTALDCPRVYLLFIGSTLTFLSSTLNFKVSN